MPVSMSGCFRKSCKSSAEDMQCAIDRTGSSLTAQAKNMDRYGIFLGKKVAVAANAGHT